MTSPTGRCILSLLPPRLTSQRLFGADKSIDLAEFEARLRSLPFKYPADCAIPVEVLAELSLGAGLKSGEDVVRQCPEQLPDLERVIAARPIDSSVASAVYRLFGGRERLEMDRMESAVLEWGMQSCTDDPVIDFECFLSRCSKYVDARNDPN